MADLLVEMMVAPMVYSWAAATDFSTAVLTVA